MENDLLKVSLRCQALYLPDAEPVATPQASTLALVAELRQLGYALAEDLLHAVAGLTDDERLQLQAAINQALGTHLNWAPLVKGWLQPTGESVWDHFVTLLANLRSDHGQLTGTTLPCGHFIPEGTFPLERYNGCPFCGTPFRTATSPYRGQGQALKVLHLWRRPQMQAHMAALLASPVPLDASQRSSLDVLLRHFPLPADVTITMKETLMLVADALVQQGRDDEAGRLFTTPADVLRYLWYRHTGHVQLLEPRTLLHTAAKNLRHEAVGDGQLAAQLEEKRLALRLKYNRQWCRRVARWLNALPMDVPRQLESMHPKRRLWVRFIRALRLAEYARRPGYDQLRQLMDQFYRTDYTVWQGQLDRYSRQGDTPRVLAMLQQRPGLFARCLFSTMLRHGAEATCEAFGHVLDRVPRRLLLTLGGQAEVWFRPAAERSSRTVRTLGGVMKAVPPHRLLARHTPAQLQAMRTAVHRFYLDAMRQHFAAQPTQSTTIYIDPQLFNIPVAVGDRQATVQDVSAALQGMRFPVVGDSVRLFLQWGKDLPAQHLDMDLSCYILTDAGSDVCSYFNLSPQGARHSGDIQRIPDRVGTAEYIELSLPQLAARGARRVVFTCNAYTQGELSPNLVVGWMQASQPMQVSNETGVAYDPSTVDHMVRITEQNLSKGLIFGVLDVGRREITWLEMPFDGQTVLGISPQTIEDYLQRLRAKPTIGQVLALKAEAQHLQQVDQPTQADEAYTLLWAQDSAQVSRLLLS